MWLISSYPSISAASRSELPIVAVYGESLIAVLEAVYDATIVCGYNPDRCLVTGGWVEKAPDWTN